MTNNKPRATGAAMQRATRSARAVPHGAEILEYVKSAKARAKLIEAADAGTPPVAAISEALRKIVGPTGARQTSLKQFTGLCVRAVLEEEGFEVAASGVRLSNDVMFGTASVYKRAVASSTEGSTLLKRIADVLSDDEVKLLVSFLKNR